MSCLSCRVTSVPALYNEAILQVSGSAEVDQESKKSKLKEPGRAAHLYCFDAKIATSALAGVAVAGDRRVHHHPRLAPLRYLPLELVVRCRREMSIGLRTASLSKLAKHRTRAMPGKTPFRNLYAGTKGGVTYQQQPKLLTLPIPTIANTAAKTLDAARPFASDPSPEAPVASDANPNEAYKRLKAAVKDFETNDFVKELQSRLEEHAKGKDSWLIDWFNSANYFGYRDPVVPWANYYYVHKDDKSRRNGPARAAGLVRALLYFRRMLNEEVLESEMIKTTPLDMSTYEWLFNSSRIPTKPEDTARAYDPSKNNHIVVVRQGNFYEFEVVDKDGNFLSEKDLIKQFERIQQLATSTAEYPIGALTTENRDTWTDARETLLKASPSNAPALERIESAIIVIALDASKPVTREEISRGIWVGDGRSRFFDKHQLVVFDNGRSGFNGEHSCMDGTPTSRLNDWLLKSLYAKKIDLGSTVTSDSELPKPKEISFSLDDPSKQAIVAAQKHFDDELSKHKISVLQYNGYGKELIKRCKTSPDSWAQLVMQYAYYKLSGCTALAGTYESAQTRKFKFGRTEVIRSATPEALEWVKTMEKTDATNVQKLATFRKAAAAHIKYAGWAADGQGIDRHIFGLKKLIKEGEKAPALFSDPSFTASSNWILSTSQLSSEFFDGWGYGQVVGEGFGLAYSVNNNNLRFTITSTTGKTEQLKQYLAEAAEEVREAIEKGMEEEPVKAKL